MMSTVESERKKTIVWLKFLYLWQAVGPSSWGRFASLYYDSVNLTPAQIGLITGCMPMVRAIVMPLWGIVADRISTKKRVALSTQLIGASSLLLLLLPTVSHSFFYIWLVSIMSACFASAGVLDAFTLTVLGFKEKSRFGEIRMWSAVSWGICNFVMGYVTDLMNGNFIVNIIIFFVCTMISTLILALIIPDNKGTPIKEEEDEVFLRGTDQIETDYQMKTKTNIRHGISLAIFFFELFIIGAGMGLVERLLFVYIVEVLGGSYTLCGLTVLATVSIEIFIFQYSKFLLDLLGHEICFLLALACYVPRVLGYTLLTKNTRHWIILIEVAHGITFGFMFSAAVDKTADLAPPGREATFQTIQNACRGCLGAGTGAILGGWYWQYVCNHRGKHRQNCRSGAIKLFRLAAAIFSTVLIVHLFVSLNFRLYHSCRRLYIHFNKERQRRTSVVVPDDASPLASPLLPLIANDEGEE